MDTKIVRTIIITASILAVVVLFVGILLGQPLTFGIGVGVGSVSAIALFYAYTRFQKYYVGRAASGEEVRLGGLLAGSFIKMLLLMGILILSVVCFHVDPFGLLLGVSAHYVSLMIVPLFVQKKASDDTPLSSAPI